MQKIGLVAKRTGAEKHYNVFKKVYDYLRQIDKEIYIEKHIADVIGLKKYQQFHRDKTDVDLIVVMGGDGTILSVVRSLHNTDVKIFGINIGSLGFMSEIPPVNIKKNLTKIFRGDYTIDKRLMLDVSVIRGGKAVKKFHALNEAVISQGSLARLIDLKTKVNGKKLTTYCADGLIISTPTGSTAYNLAAGGPIVYPSLNIFIITPICPHSFTQKPIVIPDSKKIEVSVESEHKEISLTIDGQENFVLKYKDEIHASRGRIINFVRLPSESFFQTLREKLDWGKKLEN